MVPEDRRGDNATGQLRSPWWAVKVLIMSINSLYQEMILNREHLLVSPLHVASSLLQIQLVHIRNSTLLCDMN